MRKDLDKIKQLLIEMRVYSKIYPKSERIIVRDELARKLLNLYLELTKAEAK